MRNTDTETNAPGWSEMKVNAGHAHRKSLAWYAHEVVWPVGIFQSELWDRVFRATWEGGETREVHTTDHPLRFRTSPNAIREREPETERQGSSLHEGVGWK
jgi:hypothetical protein